MTTPNTLTARLRRLLTGLGLATLAVLSHAAPVTYKESVDDDLSTYGALKVMALDTGVNTVSGTMGIRRALLTATASPSRWRQAWNC